jgi:nitrite reductase/ring-hydroxylating ferredoxin subunit
MAETIQVCKTSDIPPGRAKTVTAGNTCIAVFNCEGEFYAISDMCPHAGGPLSQGWVDGTMVTCPWHGWSFDLSPEKAAANDGADRYTVKVEGDDISVEIP